MVDILSNLLRCFTDQSIRLARRRVKFAVGAFIGSIRGLISGKRRPMFRLRERAEASLLASTPNKVLSLVVQTLEAPFFDLLQLVGLDDGHDAFATVWIILLLLDNVLLLWLLNVLQFLCCAVVRLVDDLLLLSVDRIGDILVLLVRHNVVFHHHLFSFLKTLVFKFARNFYFN